MHKRLILGLIVLLAPLAGCGGEPAPLYGHGETFDRRHIEFGGKDGADLESRTRVKEPLVRRDEAGLLHVDAQIRNTTDTQLYVDCFITFYRDGQSLGKPLGPNAVTLRPNLFEDVTFTSPQPATEYMLTFEYSNVIH